MQNNTVEHVIDDKERQSGSILFPIRQKLMLIERLISIKNVH